MLKKSIIIGLILSMILPMVAFANPEGMNYSFPEGSQIELDDPTRYDADYDSKLNVFSGSEEIKIDLESDTFQFDGDTTIIVDQWEIEVYLLDVDGTEKELLHYTVLTPDGNGEATFSWTPDEGTEGALLVKGIEDENTHNLGLFFTVPEPPAQFFVDPSLQDGRVIVGSDNFDLIAEGDRGHDYENIIVAEERGAYMILYWYGDYSSLGTFESDWELTVYNESTEESQTVTMSQIRSALNMSTADRDYGFIVLDTTEDGSLPILDREEHGFVSVFTLFTNIGDNLGEGVYSYSIYDDRNFNYVSIGDSVFYIDYSYDYNLPLWNMEAENYRMPLGRSVQWNFTRNTELFWELYTYHNFRDVTNALETDSQTINEILSEWSLNNTLRYSSTKEGTNPVTWDFTPEVGFEWSNGVDSMLGGDETFYLFEVNDEYEVRTTRNIDESLIAVLGAFGMDNELGQFLFAVIVLTAVGFMIAVYNVPLIFAFVALVAWLGVFTVFGFLPAWIIVIVGMALIVIIGLFVFGGGRGE